MDLTVAHWLYGIMTLVVIVTMLFRKGVVLPTIIGTFLVSVAYKGSLVGGFQALFNANLVAAKELFTIFLIITFMVALLHSLKDTGADERMIAPMQKVMKNGHIAFAVLLVVTYVISLFFWPTPAVPLICTLLVPAAIRAGLSPIACAMVVSIAGQGMALSSDYIMQIAPMLTAKSAGIQTSAVSGKVMILSLITGGVAIAITYFTERKSIGKSESEASLQHLQSLANNNSSANEIAATTEATVGDREREKWGKIFAVLVPLSLLAVIIFMFSTKIGNGKMSGFEGGDGAAFIGGVATMLLVVTCVAFRRLQALDKISEHITEGFVFAFRAMGPVIPIAAFFFLGSSDFSGTIFSLGENVAKPAFLVDLVQAGQSIIPHNSVLTAFGLLITGAITGLEGSGFSGLPLVGALSGALAPGVGMEPGTLGAIGQMGSVWTGGGTLIAWSSLVAVASFCGVNVLELARKNLLPVATGLIVSTIFALVIW
ncbi:hypothetical protein ACFVR2_16925 [Gottfriedia sp. NPDC057991]|uniref:hypothetical protein n=1 Tax=Gottfriedia sp. NPDC057991 TaxID=3346298 RepID=UPI0036DE9991